MTSLLGVTALLGITSSLSASLLEAGGMGNTLGGWGAGVTDHLSDLWADAFAVGLLAGLWWLWQRAERERVAGQRERRLREELEAYAQLDMVTRPGDSRPGQVSAEKALAMLVCRTVADKSPFQRVMMLLRNADGQLLCVGSVGVDDQTVAAIERWGAEMMRAINGQTAAGSEPVTGTDPQSTAKAETAEPPAESVPERTTRHTAWLKNPSQRSVPIALGEWEQFDPEVSTWAASGRPERRRWRRAIVMPIRTGARSGLAMGKARGPERLVGAIVVCSDGLAAEAEAARGRGRGKVRIERLVSGLESLAHRLSRQMESEALAGRLLRAEKLAGLGQLAGGVAHALNNPLTSVLGFAELIAETTTEPRVQADARTIATEALRMKETVQRLTEFWRPATMSDEAVLVDELVWQVAGGCRGRLTERGVALEVQIQGPVSPVRGCSGRVRQVLEHLLNNAAQAIAAARPREEGEQHRIRIAVAQDEQILQIVVSDTGTGFAEPTRAFDPFYTTRDPVEGAGMGLSICYGIVREHGGEIAAHNLHPHGAAVVVELPLGRTVAEEATEAVGKELGSRT